MNHFSQICYKKNSSILSQHR